MNSRAFSLIEVVVALGIISFALVSIIGLFSVGLEANKESSEQIQAADLASLLMATARAMPTNPPPGFALPNLNQGAVTNTVRIGADGTTTSANLSYNLYYVVGTNADTGSKLANVYLRLWWPVGAAMPVNNPGTCYEVVGQIALP
jgi:uncharacterized protein (TIGR02598 family)